MFDKLVVIDCKSHILGRLASVIAKELLSGQKIVCVRCEEINISGRLQKNEFEYHEFLRKRTNTNPKKGPIHHRAPSRILLRAVRGMLPHKKPRGAAALAKFMAYDGCPSPYGTMKRVVVPDALTVLRLAPGRKFTRLGDLSEKVGWKYGSIIKKLEDKRKAKATEWYRETKGKGKQ